MSNPNQQNTTNLVPVQAIFDPNGQIVSLIGPGGEYFSPPISFDTIVNSTIDSSPIGQTTPSSGAFTTLLASGNTQLQTLSATTTSVNSLTINGSLTVGGSAGTPGQLLQSTGTGAQWITASISGINITDDTTSATVFYPTLANSTTGTALTEYTSSTKLQFTPSTGTLYATIGSFNNLTVSGSTSLNLTGYLYGNGTGAVTASTTIPNTSITGLGTMSTQNSNSVSITGGSITGVSLTLDSLNSTPVGNTTPSTGAFTSLSGTSITDSSLTMGQVTFAGTGGLLSGSANFYWDNSNFRLGIGTSTPSVSVSIATTDAILVPVGTTAQRPATPSVGELRYNSSTFQFEGYSGATPAWNSVGGATIVNDTTTNSNEYPLFANSTSGSATTVYTSSPDYLFNPSLGTLYASQEASMNGLMLFNNTISNSYTLDTNYNGLSVGPVTVATGVTITVPTGQSWVIL